ncbi:MAG TPA: hypothetical protein VFG87_01330 [Amycolatopsis sp.]|jgi:hypothetical protein|nr:hypothetical protein [Amycolatopsis sp.]
MRITAWGRRAAIASCGVAAVLAITPAASADTSQPSTPSYAPITLTPQESQQLCAVRLPKLEDRATKLMDRINGGANVPGSVAWLQARAQNQRAKGHNQIADQLDQRAQRRASRVDDLKSVEQRLQNFKNTNCKVTS